MNRFIALLFSCFLSLYLGLAGTSSASEVPPLREPVLPRAPARAEWTITVRYDRAQAGEEIFSPGKKKAAPQKEEAEAPNLRPVQIQVSKDGSIYRERIRWSNGKRTEKWLMDGLQLRELPRDGRVVRVDMNSYSSDFSDYRRSDFEAAEWVAKSNYVGPKKVGSRNVHEFAVDGRNKKLTPREIALSSSHDAMSDTDGVEPQGESERPQLLALLDADSQLPLYVDDGNVVLLYQYSPSAGSLTAPEKFARQFQEWKDLIKAKTRVPTPP